MEDHDRCFEPEPAQAAPSNCAWSDGELTIARAERTTGVLTDSVGKSDCIVLVDKPYSVDGAYGADKPRRVEFHKGDFTFHQDGVTSTSVANSNGLIYLVKFNPKFRADIEATLPRKIGLDEPVTATSGLQNATAYTLMLNDFLESGSHGGLLRAESIITLMLGDIYRRLGIGQSNQQWFPLSSRVIALIDDYIDANLSEKIGVKELADLANISPFHFSRAFKTTTGLPPHQYLIRKRLEKIREMLKNPTKSLAQIAFETGFSSQSHMSTSFHKHFGVTPAKFRTEAQR